MTAQLIIRDDSGRVKFDSRLAVGGVCMGLFEIPSAGITLSFPYMETGRTPFVVFSDGQTRATWTYNESGGYPNFVFPSQASYPAGYRAIAGVYLK